ncbi:MAG: class I SAM-dependent methyltransferase [Alphaproteobacteria bacterium]|jgi:cyclopropane-fatty-acyl-phospholipid synthase|nr:class I SAM-dependent methyltransferase [Alphaproteobacteria bacterium]
MLAGTSLKESVKFGALSVIDATGRKHRFVGDAGPEVTIRVTDPALHFKLFHNPQLAMGEAYMDGTLIVEEGTLADFIEICAANQRALEATTLQRLLNVYRQVLAAIRVHNPIGAAQRKVAHHYDLRDELFDLFLDSDRQYSCAYFADPSDDIETAQRRKKAHIAAKLLLEDGQKVLDIGSGWGGMGLYLSGLADIQVEGVTLSREQHKVSNERAWKAGRSDRVAYHLRDYRELDARYDRIVSVGMLEHVGPRHYGEFYAKVSELLTDDGVALIHCVGKFNQPGPQNPWMERYIFPGAYTPTLAEQMPWIEKTDLMVTDVEILRLHYAETLRCWHDAFQRNRDEIAAMYDERFCRMWEFYLLGCEAAFRHGVLMVFQIQLAKSLETVPLTRDYIHDFERARLGEQPGRPVLGQTGD